MKKIDYSINSYSHHAPDIRWLFDFYYKGDAFFYDNDLNSFEYGYFRQFLRDAALTQSGYKSELAYLIHDSLGVNSSATWTVLLINLANNSHLLNWFFNRTKAGDELSKADIVRMLEEDGYDKKIAWDIFNSLTKISVFLGSVGLRTVLKFSGNYTYQHEIIKRDPYKPDDWAFLYGLYVMAEKNNTYNISFDSLISGTDKQGSISPFSLFGTAPEQVDETVFKLQYTVGSIRKKSDFGLAAVELDPYVNSLDILRLARERKLIPSVEPFITKKDIKEYFSCADELADMIMQNPDLHRFQVGKKFWYVDRALWQIFLYNLLNFSGLRDLKQSFESIARKTKSHFIPSDDPAVTKSFIKDFFSSEDDRAEEIMKCPDLHRYQVGKKFWYVDRGLWNEFISNCVNHDGIRNLKRGFLGETTKDSIIHFLGPDNSALRYILSLDLTDEETEMIIDAVQRKGLSWQEDS